MATTKEQLQSVISMMPGMGDVTSRAMMGEYVLYYRGRVFGGVYDGRLLVKNLPSAKQLLSDAAEVVPYPGAKTMLCVQNPEPVFMLQLLEAMYPELPENRKRK